MDSYTKPVACLARLGKTLRITCGYLLDWTTQRAILTSSLRAQRFDRIDQTGPARWK
jgi:hypothetical protein